MEVQLYYIRLQGTGNKDRIKESSNYRGSNYGGSTVVVLNMHLIYFITSKNISCEITVTIMCVINTTVKPA